MAKLYPVGVVTLVFMAGALLVSFLILNSSLDPQMQAMLLCADICVLFLTLTVFYVWWRWCNVSKEVDVARLRRNTFYFGVGSLMLGGVLLSLSQISVSFGSYFAYGGVVVIVVSALMVVSRLVIAKR
jgi:hypothetical protein